MAPRSTLLFFTSTKLPTRLFADLAARPEPRERADQRPSSHTDALEMAEGPDLDPVLKGDAGADHDVRPDGHVGAQARVEAEPDGGGIDERRPSLHRGPAQPTLDNAFGGGELDAVVDAHDLFRRRFGDGTDAALRPDDGREVGQVVLAALVVVADRIQQREE